MNSTLAEEALEVGAVLHDSISAAGGVDLLRRAAVDPRARSAAGSIVDALGLWDLNPLEDQLELEVAAAASRSAGFFALPYPVVERLARTSTSQATTLVDGSPRSLVSHGDLPLEWVGVDASGSTYSLADAGGGLLGTKIAPFAVEMTTELAGEGARDVAALAMTLQSWWLLGLLDHAVEDVVRYTREREQFGRHLISFQAVGFQLADMAVATEALAELAKYTLWRLAVVRDDALVDAVALRSAALDAASVVMRAAHQLYGAMGFTDEVDVSWLSRASQMVRRLPEGRHASAGRLASLIAAEGWANFGHADGASSAAAGERVRYA